MKCVCPECQTAYNVPENKLTRAVNKAVCKKCGATMLINKETGMVETETQIPESTPEPQFSDPRVEEPIPSVMSMASKEKGTKLAKSVEKAVSIFEPEVKSRKVKITEDERGIVISLVADAFFESGSAELTPEGEQIVDKMGRFLSSKEFRENDIRVEGHTDSIPPGGDVKEKFDTNWELSTARSVMIIKRFQAAGVPGGQLQAVGYGEYQPVESNDIEEGRAYNRRIEIIIMRKQEYSLY